MTEYRELTLHAPEGITAGKYSSHAHHDTSQGLKG